ncbi:MAG: class I SAM-dependent methyltransferase [Ferrovibrionaceae bacterium]
MSDTASLHQRQIDYWNGEGASHWVERQAQTDAMLQPVTAALLTRASAMPGNHVLDVGCGCGDTTLRLAEAVGPAGRVTGIDISAPMLAVAADRLRGFPQAGTLLADAAGQPLPAADLIVSRFGVMFFGDPKAAFANLRRALRPGGRIVFACWRRFDENVWARLALMAAYGHVPRLPRMDPRDPGPFAFADPGHVGEILDAAGFTGAAIDPVDLAIAPLAGGTLAETATQLLEIGPASRAVAGQPPETVAAVARDIEKALEPYQGVDGIKLPAAIWIVEARA